MKPAAKSCWALALLSALPLGAVEKTELIEATRNLDAAAVRTLIQQKVNVNASDGDGSTALHWASFGNDLEIADLLLRAGANPNTITDLGVTPLWPACLNGNAAMVRRLLRARANPNAALLLGETLVMTASRSGNAEVVELLLAAGADPNTRPTRKETTPCLFDSSRTCSVQAGGQSALMWAVAQKHHEVIEVLLSHGADVNARSHVYAVKKSADLPHPVPENQRAFPQGGDTALIFAARLGDLVSTKLLVNAKANVNDADGWGISAMAMAAYNNHGDVVEYLLAFGADPNLPSSEVAPLHAAIFHRNERLVDALLARGADPNLGLRAWTGTERGSRDRWIHPSLVGASPLWLAARFGTPKMMRLLVERGADPLFVHHSAYYDPTIGSVATANVGIDAPRLTETSTVLMAAVGIGGMQGIGWPMADPKEREAEVLEAVKLALELGVDINAVNRFNRTCKVPWKVPAGQRRQCVEVERPDQEAHGRFSPPRTALEGARALGYRSVAAFLMANGGIGADVPITQPKTVHHD
jgi:ankyrin repeat protein